MSAPVRVAVVGAGGIAQVAHLPVLRKLHAETQRNPSALFLVEQVDLTGVSAKVDGVKFVNRTVSYDTSRFK